MYESAKSPLVWGVIDFLKVVTVKSSLRHVLKWSGDEWAWLYKGDAREKVGDN